MDKSLSNFIELVLKNRVAYITLNRTKANCYEINFMKQLIDKINEAEENKTVKVIVVKSGLEKFFSAGADIKVFEANSVAENKEMVKHAQKAANLLASSKKITLAAIKGHALGGGLELAMACDIRLGARGDYLLGLPEIKLGLIPGNGGTQRLVRLISKTAALELLLTGDSIGPDKAHSLGLLNHLFEQKKFEDKIIAYAENLAQGPAMAMNAIKQCVNKGLELSLKEGLALEDELVAPLYDTEDAKEGYQAFLEKRKPKFK